jgi:hypothetical protein
MADEAIQKGLPWRVEARYLNRRARFCGLAMTTGAGSRVTAMYVFRALAMKGRGWLCRHCEERRRRSNPERFRLGEWRRVI